MLKLQISSFYNFLSTRHKCPNKAKPTRVIWKIKLWYTNTANHFSASILAVVTDFIHRWHYFNFNSCCDSSLFSSRYSFSKPLSSVRRSFKNFHSKNHSKSEFFFAFCYFKNVFTIIYWCCPSWPKLFNNITGTFFFIENFIQCIWFDLDRETCLRNNLKTKYFSPAMCYTDIIDIAEILECFLIK